jgi:hypothetical protein
MRHTVLAFLVSLILSASVFAQQIKIDAKNQIANVGNGYCGHCCIETIARHYGIKGAEGRVAGLYKKWGEYGGHMRDDEIVAALDEYHIIHYTSARGSYNYYWLRWALDSGIACIAHLKPPPGTDVGHFVTLVGVYSDRVGIIDSNRVGNVIWYPREKFISRWSGGFIMVCPK